MPRPQAKATPKSKRNIKVAMLNESTPMKSKSFQSVRHGLLLLPLFALLLGGCSLFSHHNKGNVMDPPDVTEGTNNVIPHLHIGDTVTITFTDGPPDEQLAPLEKPIKEDGTITLPNIGRVKAAGKSPGELEDAIHDLYVPKYYKHLNVTVKASNDQVYYVRGEVQNKNRFIYSGPITVSKAITSAGDVTEFADKSDVTLIRANGNRFNLNLNRILAGKDPDPPVYPGDQIDVGRKIF
jgi:protein involved in polysaccharide export with SLBB domain